MTTLPTLKTMMPILKSLPRNGLRHPRPQGSSTAAKRHSLETGRRTDGNCGGFTLIEMLITVAIASILSMIAIPSFQTQLQRVRRSDAMVSMIQVQLAESRWRANSSRYGSLADIGVATVSASGHYGLRFASESPDTYRLVTTAIGAQASDSACRVFILSVTGAAITRDSGPDSETSNDAATNRRCWGS